MPSKIVTSHIYPPIPIRQFDWCAVTDNYDADCDQDGFFSTHPVGYGATEAEAIADLRAQLDEDVCPECGADKCCYACASQGGPGADLLPQPDAKEPSPAAAESAS